MVRTRTPRAERERDAALVERHSADPVVHVDVAGASPSSATYSGQRGIVSTVTIRQRRDGSLIVERRRQPIDFAGQVAPERYEVRAIDGVLLALGNDSQARRVVAALQERRVRLARAAA